jgi:hypothetical protein
MKRHYFILTLLSLFIVGEKTSAQIGGDAVYSFLDVSSSARIAALGGTFISVKDNDLNSALQNPALLNSSMEKQLAFSGVSYYDKVKFGDAAYAFKVKKYGTFSTAMHYANYGEFMETDATGEQLGTFRAADYAFSIGYSHQLNQRISIGANLKTIYSDYYIVNSFGVAADIGATYIDTAHGLTVSIVGRNIGAQIDPYTENNSEPLPIEVIAAASKRLKHVPFRINLTARHLEKFDITYVDPNDPDNYDPITGEQTVDEVSIGEKIMRHFIVGGELLLSDNFHLRLAYNFERRQEMMVDTRKRTVGFSWGFGLRISKFHISYGRATYHLDGGSNHFSITTNLSEFYKK